MPTETLVEDLEAEEVERDQYLIFKSKSQEYGFRAMRVQEIALVPSITEVPNAPPYIEGVLNLRGRLTSVVNFRQKFGLERMEHGEDTRIVIVEQRGFPIGILVDSVEEVLRIDDEALQEMPEASAPTVSRGSVTGVGVLGDRLIILLDVDSVLDDVNVAELLPTPAELLQTESDPTEADALGDDAAAVTEKPSEAPAKEQARSNPQAAKRTHKGPKGRDGSGKSTDRR